ncbi:MAG: CvpA family protein [Ruminococcus sp.]|uniref:CvpA family protein n=1 Tax=Ruminococcus sp. TaxID=41978 RepID=UPI0025FC0A21|nr:CvpA family protein [Ruminococcus sp.]MBO4867016.1 CvpA family protein [Ruminococcus sp.]
MAFILDASVFLILVVTCIVGYTKGFRRSIIGMIAAVIATVSAAAFSDALAEPVYNRYMRDKVKAHVMKAIEDADPKEIVMDKLRERGYGDHFTEAEIGETVEKGGDLDKNISELMKSKGYGHDDIDGFNQEIDSYLDNELPVKISSQMEKAGLSRFSDSIKISTEDMRECVTRIATQSKADAADYIVEKAVSPIMTGVIRCLLFLISYLVMILLLKLIVAVSGILDKMKEVKAADRFAGLALGTIQGLLYCAVIAWALSVFCRATKDSLTVFNAGIAEETYLFRYFFDFFHG